MYMCAFFFSQSERIPAHTDGQDDWPAGENVRAQTCKVIGVCACQQPHKQRICFAARMQDNHNMARAWRMDTSRSPGPGSCDLLGSRPSAYHHQLVEIIIRNPSRSGLCFEIDQGMTVLYRLP